jgi:sugar phosphate isomerase/epimerase
MDISYSISLWNFSHYHLSKSLEDILGQIQSMGYGVELWRHWQGQRDLFGTGESAALTPALSDMDVSVHTCGPRSMEEHRSQVDSACDLGARLIVLHPGDVATRNGEEPDIALLEDLTAYAGDKGVVLALENGPLRFLAEAADRVPGLGICLDVGHVYFEDEPMSQFLAELKDDLVHLHIQDTLPGGEGDLPDTGADHYIPGTGGIPQQDWELLAQTLKEVDYTGCAVFEIRPRNPWQTALLGKEFMQKLA